MKDRDGLREREVKSEGRGKVKDGEIDSKRTERLRRGKVRKEREGDEG